MLGHKKTRKTSAFAGMRPLMPSPSPKFAAIVELVPAGSRSIGIAPCFIHRPPAARSAHDLDRESGAGAPPHLHRRRDPDPDVRAHRGAAHPDRHLPFHRRAGGWGGLLLYRAAA